MKKKALLGIVILLSLILAACGPGDTTSAIATGVFQTQQISQLQTQAAGAGNTNDAQDDGQDSSSDADDQSGNDDENNDSATETSTPTVTETPTPDVPTITLSQNTNCRSGPAVYYGFVTTVNAGVQMEVVGVPSDSTITEYAIVKNPSGSGNCWMWLRYADNKDFSAYSLQSYNTPATPTPTFTPTPSFDWVASWTIYVGSPGSYSTYTMPVTVSGSNFSASFSYGGGDTVALSGSVSADLQTASGSFTDTGGPNGTFQFQIKSGNLNQFVGNGNNGAAFDWCGAKNAASQPSPCIWP